MIRLWRQWRTGLLIERTTEASTEVGKECLRAIEEGGAMRRRGEPQPRFPEWNPPPYDAAASRGRRAANLDLMLRHAWEWGRAAGWALSGNVVDLDTTAEKMCRDAEAYANRGHG